MALPAHISSTNRARTLLGLALVGIAGAVWFTSQMQRDTTDRAFDASRAGQRMLTAMLDQETGLRGYLQARDAAFLQPYRTGVREFEAAIAEARRTTGGEFRVRIAAQTTVARRWQRLAERELELRRDPGVSVALAAARERKAAFDRFRVLNAQVQARLTETRDRDLSLAGIVSVGVVIGLGLLFGGIGYVTIERGAIRARRRREGIRSYRATQADFTETMQVMRNEREAFALVKRHLERTIDGAEVTVLNRNNSDNRLVSATHVPGDSPLSRPLRDAGPDSCLAVRLARAHERGAGRDPLLSCGVCGASGNEVVCVPSLVGGEVIGAVLVQHERPLRADERERVGETVAQSAPVLANLRTLAIAEARAATDALTGLPNARSCQDTLKRMVAQAGRSLAPLSAVLVDLDHFKQINDRYGHGTGDDVLAATGQVLASALRASDFAGRAGGEEFLLLLPETGHEGALQVAEKLRVAIADIHFPRVDREVTASLGVATYPLDAGDGDGLVRQADRALYAAKRAGRNRVELASTTAPPDDGDAAVRSGGTATAGLAMIADQDGGGLRSG